MNERNLDLLLMRARCERHVLPPPEFTEQVMASLNRPDVARMAARTMIGMVVAVMLTSVFGVFATNRGAPTRPPALTLYQGAGVLLVEIPGR